MDVSVRRPSVRPDLDVKDRVVELRRVRASDLLPNPRNWRKHPKAQVDALSGLLGEIGFADVLLARDTPAGLQLIDGHLRAGISGDMEVPVVVLDLNEAEADKLLLTLDPLAGMAEANSEALEALLRDVQTDSEAIETMLAKLAVDSGVCSPFFEPIEYSPRDRLDEILPIKCPKCGYEFSPLSRA